MEWTFRNGQLYLLQSRPVTTRAQPSAGDQRAWHLSLHRSFENLKDPLPTGFDPVSSPASRPGREWPKARWTGTWASSPLDPVIFDGLHPRVAWWASVNPFSSKRDLIVIQISSFSMCERKSLRWG